MISHAQEKWNPTEGHNLAINEIRALDLFVFGDRQRLLDVIGLMLDVFIEAAGQTQVAQMPVERGLILLCCLRNSRHHDVAAIPGITGRNEAPGPSGWLLCNCRLNRQHQKYCDRNSRQDAANHLSSRPESMPYVPVHFGSRLFRNASIPSRKSWLI